MNIVTKITKEGSFEFYLTLNSITLFAMHEMNSDSHFYVYLGNVVYGESF